MLSQSLGDFIDFLDAVSPPIDRKNLPAMLRTDIELPPDPTHMGIDGAGIDIGIQTPKFFEQENPREQNARALEHVTDQLEFFLGKLDRFAINLNATSVAVDPVVAEIENL
jgi:hypothetical protein